MATQTFTLEGQSYTVPHGTSMDELDAYIKGQKKGPDALTQQTQAAAKAGGSTIAPVPGSKPALAGASAAAPPLTGGKMMKKGLFNEDISAEGEENIGRARAAFERVPSDIARPLSAVEGARGLAELPGAVTGLAKRGVSALRRFSYEPPEKISLGPLGKINRNVPPNPYEEMGASAQYRAMGREAIKPPKTEYSFPGAQSSAPGAATGSPTPFAPPEGGPPVTATGPMPKMMPPRGYPGVESGSPTSGTPGAATAEGRPTGTEEFLTNLVKKPIWTPEDSVDVRNAFGRDGLMRPGEGQTQYRARLMGMIRSSRAAQGMTDIESYPAPKRPR